MISSFLLMGQSNMAGQGELSKGDITHPNILVFKNNVWETAKEPYHSDGAASGAGLAASFAQTLLEDYAGEIGFIPCAFGGSKISEWQPGKRHFENAVTETKKALKTSALKGILWHQGENDANISLEHTYGYKAAFNNFFNAIYSELNLKDTPFIMGELGSFLKSCEFWREINAKIRELVSEDKRRQLVSAEGLTHKGDEVHFCTAALREFGVRYASAWKTAARRLDVTL